jgi:hypothetical protein
MPLRLPSLLLIRLWTVLLLTAISWQATLPAHAPLEVRHGSAFSAATPEVAVAPERRWDARQVLPLPMPRPEQTPVSRAAPARFVAVPASRPDSTGPPAATILVRQPGPRAPPTF